MRHIYNFQNRMLGNLPPIKVKSLLLNVAKLYFTSYFPHSQACWLTLVHVSVQCVPTATHFRTSPFTGATQILIFRMPFLACAGGVLYSRSFKLPAFCFQVGNTTTPQRRLYLRNSVGFAALQNYFKIKSCFSHLFQCVCNIVQIFN